MSPWGNYTFRVRARNKIGDSEPSAPSEHCTTPEEVPFQNPDKVIGKGTHPNNLVISWTVSIPFEYFVHCIALICKINKYIKASLHLQKCICLSFFYIKIYQRMNNFINFQFQNFDCLHSESESALLGVG